MHTDIQRLRWHGDIQLFGTGVVHHSERNLHHKLRAQLRRHVLGTRLALRPDPIGTNSSQAREEEFWTEPLLAEFVSVSRRGSSASPRPAGTMRLCAAESRPSSR